jgi:hypothetical protein
MIHQQLPEGGGQEWLLGREGAPRNGSWNKSACRRWLRTLASAFTSERPLGAEKKEGNGHTWVYLKPSEGMMIWLSDSTSLACMTPWVQPPTLKKKTPMGTR